jgi:chromatin segregation and condensation protein Rec8/ScpA/Scc1 (kleisin family)
VPLEEVFAAAATRLEAVVTFLCLLELLKRGEVSVESDPAAARDRCGTSPVWWWW